MIKSSNKHLYFLALMVLLLIFLNTATQGYAQPDLMTARSFSLGGAIGSLSGSPDAVNANPAELSGAVGPRVWLTNIKNSYSWTPDSLITSSGQLKRNFYIVHYQQPFFGFMIAKGTQKLNPEQQSQIPNELNNIEFLFAELGVSDLYEAKSSLGISGTYHQYEFKLPDNNRKKYSYYSTNVGMTYITENNRYRLSIFCINAYGEKKKIPRFDDYGNVILIEREPQDLHGSLGILVNEKSLLLFDAGYLLDQKLEVSFVQADTLFNPQKWRSHRNYRFGFESVITAKTSLRVGTNWHYVLHHINRVENKLIYEKRTTYYTGGKLSFNRFNADVAISYEKMPDQIIDETMDTRGHVFTFAGTISLQF